MRFPDSLKPIYNQPPPESPVGDERPWWRTRWQSPERYRYPAYLAGLVVGALIGSQLFAGAIWVLTGGLVGLAAEVAADAWWRRHLGGWVRYAEASDDS